MNLAISVIGGLEISGICKDELGHEQHGSHQKLGSDSR